MYAKADTNIFFNKAFTSIFSTVPFSVSYNNLCFAVQITPLDVRRMSAAFEGASMNIFALMRADSFGRYLQSSQYALLQATLERSASLF
jgi:hypothetical protein